MIDNLYIYIEILIRDNILLFLLLYMYTYMRIHMYIN